jgi:hypothetical protein
MEPQPAYRDFDDSLQDVAELWMEMVDVFKIIRTILPPENAFNVKAVSRR